jgi:hypothetical protein
VSGGRSVGYAQKAIAIGPSDKSSQCPSWVKLRRTQPEQMSSGLLLKADIALYSRHVSKVPQADIPIGEAERVPLRARLDLMLVCTENRFCNNGDEVRWDGRRYVRTLQQALHG